MYVSRFQRLCCRFQRNDLRAGRITMRPIGAEVYNSPVFDGAPLRIESVEPQLPSRKADPCVSFEGAFLCGIEWDEWMMVDALVQKEDAVIEFGGRYGTTSCRLAWATRNSGRVVTVEPDRRVLHQLLRNRQAHNCSFTVVSGTVSDVPLAMPTGTLRAGSGYGENTRLARRNDPLVGNVEFGSLQQVIGAKFTVALIDCEGCIAHVAQAPGDLFASVSLILIEEDQAAADDKSSGRLGTGVNNRSGLVYYHRYWHSQLRALGFENVWFARDTFGAKWSRDLRHSAWRHPRAGIPIVDECRAHVARTGRLASEISCLPLIR